MVAYSEDKESWRLCCKAQKIGFGLKSWGYERLSAPSLDSANISFNMLGFCKENGIFHYLQQPY
jgi:hypothetical protein